MRHRGPGDGFHVFDDLAEIGVEAGRIGVALIRERQVSGEDVSGIDTEIHGEKVEETAAKEACAREEDERESDFADDERSAKSAAAASRAASAFFERGGEIGARRAERGSEAEDDACNDGE